MNKQLTSESIPPRITELEVRLQRFVSRAAERLQADMATLYLYDVKRDKFYMPVGYGLKEETTFKFAMPRSDRIAGKIVKGGEPIWADDAKAHPNMSGPFTFREGIASAAGFPIFLGDEATGVFFASYRRPHHFTAEEIEFIQDQLLLGATEILAAALLAEVRETFATLSPTKGVTESMLDFVIRSTCTFTDAPVILWILETATNRLSIRASTGIRLEFAESATVPLDEHNFLTEVLHSGQPVSIPNLQGDPRFPFPGELERENWRSILGVPVRMGAQVAGVLTILGFAKREFAPWEHQFLTELAERMGDVLASERHAQLLASLRDIGPSLTAKLDLSDLLQSIVDAAAQIFGADLVILYPYDQAHQECGEASACGLSSESGELPGLAEMRVVDQILAHKQPILANGAGSDQRLASGFAAREGIRTWAGFPLQVGEEAVGVLLVAYHTAHQFLDTDRELLELFATQAAVAIKNAYLFEEEQRRVALARIADTFRQTMVSRRTLQAIVKGACELTGAASSSLFLLNPETDRFERDARWPESTELPTELPRREDGLTYTILKTGNHILIPDTVQDKRVRKATIEEGKRSLLGVPVRVRGQPIGVLYANSGRTNHFRRRDVRFLQALADYGAIAIERTQPLDAITSVNEATANILGLDELISELLGYIVDHLGFRFAALQLVNQESHTVETVDGINAPWAAEAKHDLDSGDIQADIIRKRQTEVISGQDERFDESIYKRYGHDKMVRIFVPLLAEGRAFGTIEAGHDLEDRPEISPQDRAALGDRVTEYAPRLWQAMLPHVLQVIVENAVHMVRAHSGSIHVLFDQKGEQYVYQACAGRIGPEFLEEYPPRKQGIGAEALRTEQPRWIDKPEELERTHPRIYAPRELWDNYRHKYPEGEGVRAIAAFPLVTGGKYEGVFYIHHWEEHTFSEDEIDWLRLFADQVSVAIKNAQFYEKLRERSLALTSLSQIGHSLLEELNLTDLLIMIARGAHVVLNADVVTIYQYYQDRDQFDTPPTIGGDILEPQFMQTPIDPGDGPWNIVHRLGRSCYAPDVRAEPLFYAADRERSDEKGRPFVDREGISSTAGILLKAHQETVGVMFVNYRSPVKFSNGERRTIENFASYAAIAIRTARKAVQQRVEQLETIQSIDLEISSIFDLDRVLELIVEKSMEYLGVEEDGYGILQLFDERSRELVIRAHRNLPPEKVHSRLHVDRDRSVTTLIARSKQPSRVPDTEQHPAYYPLVPGMRSEVAVPLVQDDRLVGVLNLESSKANAFDESVVAFLTLLANQAVVAIQNARYVEQLEQLRGVLEAIASTTDLRTVLEQIAESTLAILQADDAVIFPYDPETNRFVLDLLVHRGQGETHYQPGLPKEGGLAYLVLEQDLVVVKDVSQAPPQLGIKANAGLLGELGTKAFVGIALKVGQASKEEILGVLYIDYRHAHSFTDSELDLIRAFARQAAIVLHRARQEERERRARALEEINTFGTNFVHKVINLLGTLPLNFDKIKRALEAGDEARLATHLRLLEGDVQRVDQILKAARTLRSFEPGERELLQINNLIRDALANSSLAEGVEVSDDLCEHPPLVEASRFSLQSLFEDLISNAAKAKARQIEVRSQLAEEGSWIEVAVKDDGSGMSEEFQARIFQPFYGTSDTGVGLGLWLGSQVVKEVGGDIQVDSERGKGTTFTVRLPVAPGDQYG
jgi:GAF domain-containing protein